MQSMTEKVYMSQPHLTTFVSQVSSKGEDKDGQFLRLSQTIFHPQGGGQPFDTGFMKTKDNRQVNVIKVLKEMPEGSKDPSVFNVKHYVSPSDVLAIGDEVEMSIDVERRRLNARLHSAGHLIAALVDKQFPMWKAVSGHHVPREARVEFDPKGETNTVKTTDIKSYLDIELPKHIQSAAKVAVHIDEKVRTIQLGEFEAVPCGGTHVADLSVLKSIEIKSVSLKSKKLRVSYHVDE